MRRPHPLARASMVGYRRTSSVAAADDQISLALPLERAFYSTRAALICSEPHREARRVIALFHRLLSPTAGRSSLVAQPRSRIWPRHDGDGAHRSSRSLPRPLTAASSTSSSPGSTSCGRQRYGRTRERRAVYIFSAQRITDEPGEALGGGRDHSAAGPSSPAWAAKIEV